MNTKPKTRRMYADVMFLDPALVAAAREEFIAEGFSFELQPWRVAEEHPAVWARVTTDWDEDELELIHWVEGIAREFRGGYDDDCGEDLIELPVDSTRH